MPQEGGVAGPGTQQRVDSSGMVTVDEPSRAENGAGRDNSPGVVTRGRQWVGQRVMVHCDNTGAVAVVNSGYSQVTSIMHLLRCLFFIRAHFQVQLRATHTTGAKNLIADAISRNNMPRFFSQVPEAQYRRAAFPHPLVALLIEQQPDWTFPHWAQLFGSSSAGLALGNDL